MNTAEINRSRMLWTELCRHQDFRGRWVALRQVRYDGGLPAEGDVVDCDADLAALCARIQGAEGEACAILLCEHKAHGQRRPPD